MAGVIGMAKWGAVVQAWVTVPRPSRFGATVQRQYRCRLWIHIIFLCVLSCCVGVSCSPNYVKSFLGGTRRKVTSLFGPVGLAVGRFRRRKHDSAQSQGVDEKDLLLSGFGDSNDGLSSESASSTSSCLEAWDEKEEEQKEENFDPMSILWACGLDSASKAPAAATVQTFHAWADQVRERWLGVLNSTAIGPREYIPWEWAREFVPWSWGEGAGQSEMGQKEDEVEAAREGGGRETAVSELISGAEGGREGGVEKWWAVKVVDAAAPALNATLERLGERVEKVGRAFEDFLTALRNATPTPTTTSSPAPPSPATLPSPAPANSSQPAPLPPPLDPSPPLPPPLGPRGAPWLLRRVSSAPLDQGLRRAWEQGRRVGEVLYEAWAASLAALQDWDLTRPPPPDTTSPPSPRRHHTFGHAPRAPSGSRGGATSAPLRGKGHSHRHSWSAGEAGRRGRAGHLYVLVHGLHGAASNLKYMAKRMRRRLGREALVHVAECNSVGFLMTHDGIDAGGARLAAEIREVVGRAERAGRELESISLLGNSLGGLYCRYAVGLLFDSASGLVAGLRPGGFITTASPHLGVRALLPRALEAVVTSVALYGRTGQQLFMADEAGGGECLLLRMASDGELPFLSGLAAFEHRVLYANVCNDFLVKLETASLAASFSTRLLRLPPVSPRFPHIVFDTAHHVAEWPPPEWREEEEEEEDGTGEALETTGGEGPRGGAFFAGDDKAPLLHRMLSALSGLGWRRVAARFERTVDGTRPLPFPLQLTNAHNKLPVVRPLLDGAGADSVEHLCSVWAQQAAALSVPRSEPPSRPGAGSDARARDSDTASGTGRPGGEGADRATGSDRGVRSLGDGEPAGGSQLEATAGVTSHRQGGRGGLDGESLRARA